MITPKEIRVYVATLFVGLYGYTNAQVYHLCVNSSITLSAVNSAGLANPSFSLEPGSITNSTGSFVVSPFSTTVFTLYVTGTSSTSAIMTTSTTATVNVVPFANFMVQSSSQFTLGCGSKSVSTMTIIPAGSGSGFTYTWFPPGTSGVIPPVLSTVTVYTISSPGTHTVVLKEGLCGYLTVKLLTVLSKTAPPAIDSIRVVPNLFCSGPTATATIFGEAQQFSWVGSSVWQPPVSSVQVLPLAGVYTVTGISLETGCTSKTVVTASDMAIYPILKHDTMAVLCNTPAVTVTATIIDPEPGDELKWLNNLGQVVTTGIELTTAAPGVFFVVASNSYGCTRAGRVVVTGCTSMPLHYARGFQYWPNPVKDELYVRFEVDGERTLELYDITSTLVKRVRVNSLERLDLSDLPVGIYSIVSGGFRGRLVKHCD